MQNDPAITWTNIYIMFNICVCINTAGRRKMRTKVIGQHLNYILRNLLYFLLSHSFQFFCQNPQCFLSRRLTQNKTDALS